jgi:inosine-uridine nucleoside N-ribohydrolase
MSLVLEDNMITKSNMVFCTVELTGTLTRGQLVVDWKQHLEKKANVQLVTEYDVALFKVLYKNMFI